MIQPLIARGDDGTEVCGPCVGFAADYTCKQCGRAGKRHSRGRCAHCVLAERVNALLAGPDGTVTPQMEPLAAALTDAPSPFPAIQWLKESPNTKLLARLAADGHGLSHELLDELPPSRNQRNIRQLLVRTGILEERHEDLERIPGWLEHELADKPAAHANLARPFLHWFLLRRARQRAAHRHHPASAGRDLRRRVSVALDLLAWMDQRGLALDKLAQEHIDDWIAGATSQRRYLIRYFLKWTTSRRLTRELTVPSIPRQEPQNLLDEDDRWPLLQRCLTDDDLPTDVRAAGAITLLFGPSTERLCHRTPEHLKFDDKHAHLVLGRHPVLLPPRLAQLLPAPRRAARAAAAALTSPARASVALPGHGPGQADSTHGMTQKLNRHGIPVRTARNAALAALTADLPSPILADLTGMHRHTALRWVAYAKRDWAEYLAAGWKTRRAVQQSRSGEPQCQVRKAAAHEPGRSPPRDATRVREAHDEKSAPSLEVIRMRRVLTAAAALALPISLAGAPAVAASHGTSPTSTVTSAQAAHTLNRPTTLVAQGPDDVCNYTDSRPSLHLGSSGAAVQQAQCYLNQAIGAGLDEDGDFGRVTQSATEDFQQCADIVVDGRIGAQTWSFLSFWANAPGAPFC
ncbi:peptidoglycan-binding protein [Streptomyces nigra]|uniref:peptidoglycan-binding domain-containing protein n=1 Tax=Streptomyces nigra TaxID=1827580 RepID=UPI00368EEF8F